MARWLKGSLERQLAAEAMARWLEGSLERQLAAAPQQRPSPYQGARLARPMDRQADQIQAVQASAAGACLGRQE
jgi:hypothetical protein